MVFKENRIVLTKDFPKIFRKYLKQKKISQNKFARQIGISGATLSQYISRQFTIPSSIFNKISLDLGIENAEEYILKMKSYKEIRRSVAYLNPKFIDGWKTHMFKKNDVRTKIIARRGGLIGGQKGGPKVSKMLMREKRGIFHPKHVNKRSEYAKRGGRAVVNKHLGPFSPNYYKLDEKGCQSKLERRVFNYLTTICESVIAVNKAPQHWFNCGENTFRLDFYLPQNDIFIEVCGCLGDPRYRTKSNRIKKLLKYHPELKIIFIVNDIKLAKQVFGDILSMNQIKAVIDLKQLDSLTKILSQCKALEPEIA